MEVYLFELPGSEESKALMVGGIHGDEPESVWIAEPLLAGFKKIYPYQHFLGDLEKEGLQLWSKIQSSIMQKKSCFVYIPCLNAHGFKHGTRTNAQKVDLNRNFPDKNWSANFSAERYCPGSKPLSEKETQWLDLFLNLGRWDFVIALHSWQAMVNFDGQRSLEMAKLLAQHLGFQLKQDISYPIPGSLGTYLNQLLETPSICLEFPSKLRKASFLHQFSHVFLGALLDLIQTVLLKPKNRNVEKSLESEKPDNANADKG